MDEDRNSVIDRWVDRELVHWEQHPADRNHVAQVYEHLNRTHFSFYLFDIDGREVTICAQKKRGPQHPYAGMYQNRAGVYCELLKTAIENHNLSLKLQIGIDLADVPIHPPDVPLFSFQKSIGSKNILLPDCDFYYAHFYAYDDWVDPPFVEKKTSAVFAGAPTGSGNRDITSDEVLNARLPRLHFARKLHGHPKIIFKISVICQCDSPETEQLLRDQPYVSERVSYQEQQAHKFQLSMDGNGATWSRVVIALKSNCALVKFDSPQRLYYYDGLVPGEHYLPVSSVEDIEAIIAQEEAQPGRFEPVAVAGTAFQSKFLTPEPMFLYLARVLARYAQLA